LFAFFVVVFALCCRSCSFVVIPEGDLRLSLLLFLSCHPSPQAEDLFLLLLLLSGLSAGL
jgi:hypothetical protein